MKAGIIYFCLVLLLLIGGCAARSQKMVPTNLIIDQKLSNSVRLSIAGGRKTHPLWTSQISNEAYAEAVTQAILNSGLFTAVVKGQGADYLLDITLVKVSQPIIGIDFKIDMETEWLLTGTKTDETIWCETISTSYTAKLTDAFVAAERLQKANEGAARLNIREGIIRLSKDNEL